MTHGHFDHVGALETSADDWDAPLYAHLLEQPYLYGRSAYPPPDPTVGGGLMALSSPLFPKGPINVDRRLRILPESGEVPHLNGWRWIPHAGARAGPRQFWAGSRSRAHCRRRLDHDPAGIRLRRDDADAGDARPADVFHARLGQRPRIRSCPGCARTGAGDLLQQLQLFRHDFPAF